MSEDIMSEGLDIGELGLSLDGEGTDSEEGLDIGALGFADEDGVLINWDDDEGDFELEGFEIGAELLQEETDISEVSFSYFNDVRDVLEKIQPPTETTGDSFKLSSSDFPYIESRYINPLRIAIMNQAQREGCEKLTPEENAQAIFDDLSKAVPFHLGAHYNAFIEMCARKWESCHKLVSATATQASTKFEQLLDRERLDTAQFVFELNGWLWHQVSIRLADNGIMNDARINVGMDGRVEYNCGIIGPAMEA